MNAARLKPLAEGFAVPIAVLLIWQLACTAGLVNPMVLPSPAAVAARWWAYLAPLEAYDPAHGSWFLWLFSGEMLHDAMASLYRVVVGFLVGAGLALPLGLFMGTSDVIYRHINPLMQVLRRSRRSPTSRSRSCGSASATRPPCSSSPSAPSSRC
jgi:NitT/TauT family transport system permease protein